MGNNRICIDARMIEMSGIGTYIQHLMNQGIYDYAIGDEAQIRKYDSDVKVISFDAPIYGIKEQLLFPIDKIKKYDISLMHFPHYNVPLKYKGDYVVTVHDLTHIIFPEFLGNKIKYYYAKFLMNNALKDSKHIFTVSENSQKDIIKYFKVDSNKITITYNAIDDDFRVKDKKDVQYLYDKYSIPHNKKLLLYVGNLKPHKNLNILLEALKILDDSNIVLLLVGKAFKSVDLEKSEEELGIKSQVIHTGMVSKEELIDLYNLADLFVFPSLYEGFGIPPLEAMACGTPVIAANNSSIPEVCGRAALLFDPYNVDSLVCTIKNIDKKNVDDYITKGLDRIRQFKWNNTVKIVKEIMNNE